MTPMFVETQSTQGPESLAATQSGPAKGMIRATQGSLEFSQTQAEGTVLPLNCLSGTMRNKKAHVRCGQYLKVNISNDQC